MLGVVDRGEHTPIKKKKIEERETVVWGGFVFVTF